MQEKVTGLSTVSSQVGLNINKGKTKVLRINTGSDEPVILAAEPLEEVEDFVYLSSMVDKKGGTDADIKLRIAKARNSFNQLKNIWNSKEIRTATKIRLFNTNVKTVLLYGAETWRTIKTNLKKLQTFVNYCLRRILKIYWPKKIRNEELWERTQQRKIEEEIKRRRWGWIGHTLRKPGNTIARQALTWNPQGKRRRGRPRNTWRRELEANTRDAGLRWQQLVTVAQDRDRWRTVVNGLCSIRSEGPK
jgi:hypothetical protein